jgi:hypothetical protein
MLSVMLRSSEYTLTPLATSEADFAGFAPYVPAISADGVVAFQASLRVGGSAVFVGRGGVVSALVGSGGGVGEIISHPDVNARGECCLYARSGRGGQCVFAVSGGRLIEVWPSAGPLGPTMNERGAVAFRAPMGSGAGVFRWAAGSVGAIAEVGERFCAFHGLPVIDERGLVLFRADLDAGGEAILLGDGKSTATIAATGDVFRGLGAFPAMNGAGQVAFSASLWAGGSGVFVATGEKSELVIDDRGPFESFRGALLDDEGRVVFYATPRGGSLGVFAGPDPQRHRVVAIGDRLLGATITEFALNPVSINGAGQLAIRVGLGDGREVIVRADPQGRG